jgi:hypothetical protein
MVVNAGRCNSLTGPPSPALMYMLSTQIFLFLISSVSSVPSVANALYQEALDTLPGRQRSRRRSARVTA